MNAAPSALNTYSGREKESEVLLASVEAEEGSRRTKFLLPLGEGEDEGFNEANRDCDFIIESVFNRRTPIRPGHRLALRWEGVSIRIRKAVASIENVWDAFCERG